MIVYLTVLSAIAGGFGTPVDNTEPSVAEKHVENADGSSGLNPFPVVGIVGIPAGPHIPDRKRMTAVNTQRGLTVRKAIASRSNIVENAKG